jgi:hypothetical protein
MIDVYTDKPNFWKGKKNPGPHTIYTSISSPLFVPGPVRCGMGLARRCLSLFHTLTTHTQWHKASRGKGEKSEEGTGKGSGSKAPLISLKREVTSFMQGGLAMISGPRTGGACPSGLPIHSRFVVCIADQTGNGKSRSMATATW